MSENFDDDIFKKLIIETQDLTSKNELHDKNSHSIDLGLSEQSFHSKASQDLWAYFEKQVSANEHKNISQYFKSQSIYFSSLNFIQRLSVYRTIIKNEVFDFPSNWAIFKNLNRDAIIHVEPSEDEAMLNEVFESMLGYEYVLTIVGTPYKMQLVFIPKLAAREIIYELKQIHQKVLKNLNVQGELGDLERQIHRENNKKSAA